MGSTVIDDDDWDYLHNDRKLPPLLTFKEFVLEARKLAEGQEIQNKHVADVLYKVFGGDMAKLKQALDDYDTLLRTGFDVSGDPGTLLN